MKALKRGDPCPNCGKDIRVYHSRRRGNEQLRYCCCKHCRDERSYTREMVPLTECNMLKRPIGA